MRKIAYLVIFVLATSSLLIAQYTTGSIGGRVTDASGASITHAKISVKETGTAATQTTFTSADGNFVFPALPVGTYQITVENTGFSTYVQNGTTLAVGQAITIQVSLQVGRVAQEVTVNSDAEMITTSTANVSQVVDERQITELPLVGRQPQTLLFLVPGANNTTQKYCANDGCQGGLYSRNGSLQVEQTSSVNGGGTQNVTYLLDGTDHNDTYVNMNLPFPNPDAIEEFNVQTNNMSAEYGQGANVVDIVTKSGTNELHGSGFEFLRNGGLNARNYFAPSHDELHWNQYGGTLGGPVMKNRLFFFGSYQGTRISSTTLENTAFVPTQAERNGDFSAITTPLKNPTTGVPYLGNQIPTTSFSGPSNFFLQHIPLPNGTNGLLTYAGVPQRQQDDQFMPKVDWSLGKHRLSGRYFYSRFVVPVDPALAEQNALTMTYGQNVKVQTVAISDSYMASGALLFSTWFGWNSQAGGNVPGAPFDFVDAGVNLPRPPGPREMDGLSVSGFFSFDGLHPGNFNRGDKTFREVVMLQRGNHELRFGGQAIRVNLHIANQASQEGYFTFSNKASGSDLSDFFLGQAANFGESAGQFTDLTGTLYGLFAQDDWHVSQKLALNLGVRWDPWWPYSETQNAVACYITGGKSVRYPNAPTGLLFGGDAGCPAGSSIYANTANVAPRFGFAYSPGKNLVVRGGAGIYFTSPQTSSFNSITGTPPFSPSISLTSVGFVDPYGSAGIPNPYPADWGIVVPGPSTTFSGPFSIYIFTQHLKIPEVATWNLMVEKQLGSDWLVSVATVGNSGSRLWNNQDGNVNVNPAIYTPGTSTIANTQARRVNPALAEIYEYVEHNSNYNALQVNLKKRVKYGVSLWANYTWSHNLDNFPENPGGSALQTNSFNRSFDYGNSIDNLPNVLHFSAVWQLPNANVRKALGLLTNGWEMTGITTWQNGFPMTIASGIDNSLSGNGEDRAEFTGTSLGQAVLGGQSHSQEAAELFNKTLFQVNPIGTYGNTEKNILRGPRYFDVDFAGMKNFQIMEGLKLQLRAEAFNFFNNVDFNAPGTTVTSTSGFGRITSAGQPRIMQLAAKIVF